MSTTPITEVAICNMALIMLGQQPITALTDNNNRATMCDARYADVRDTILRRHTWNCSVKRDTLTASGTAPEYDYLYKFPLPADFIRLVDMEDSPLKYRIEAGNQGEDDDLVIVTDSPTMKITYIAQITDVSKFDHTLKHAIATKLAAEIALAITGDNALAERMHLKHLDLLADAKFEDSSDHSKVETFHVGQFVQARRGLGLPLTFPDLNDDGSVA